MFFDALVNVIAFLVSDSYSSSLVYENATVLARWLSWLERRPIHQKVAGSVPGQGMYERQLIDVSLSLSPFLSL